MEKQLLEGNKQGTGICYMYLINLVCMQSKLLLGMFSLRYIIMHFVFINYKHRLPQNKKDKRKSRKTYHTTLHQRIPVPASCSWKEYYGQSPTDLWSLVTDPISGVVDVDMGIARGMLTHSCFLQNVLIDYISPL